MTEDIQIKAGGLTTNWNPLCHLNYWNDDEVITRVADFIRETLDSPTKEQMNA